MMNRKIPVTRPYTGTEEISAVKSVLESGWLVQGTKVKEFEQRIAEHEEVKYCCATTSCTTALQLAMLAGGMHENMDVLVPSFTFVATANAVISTGATPILLDICADTYNLDADQVEKYIRKNYFLKSTEWINKKSGNKLWGIIPVHQFGLCADMDRISRTAQKYNIKIIEDAACALGAKIADTHIGNWGIAACVSFHPRKSITTGEGGMILTNDETLYHKALELRNHGSAVASNEREKEGGYLLPEFVSAGFNYRMTDVQGAIGCEQIKKLDYILHKRAEIAQIYQELLAGRNAAVKTPHIPKGYTHTFQSYVCLLNLHSDIATGQKKRSFIMQELEKSGISTRQGTHAVHKLEYYRKRFGYKNNDLPVADYCDSLSITLPVYVGLSRDEQVWIAKKLLNLLESVGA